MGRCNSRDRQRRRSWTFKTAGAVVLVMGLNMSLVTTPAQAQITPQMSAELAYDGFANPIHDAVIIVTVSADRLVKGEVRVRGLWGGPIAAAVVEVAGGSRKSVLLVLPSDQNNWGAPLRVELHEGGQLTEGFDLQNIFRGNGDDDLVGVLGNLSDDLPSSSRLAIDLGEARLFPLTSDWLENGSRVLDPLGTIVTTADALSELSTAGHISLANWLSGGRTLLVDEAAQTRIPGFDLLVPEAGAAHDFGAGTVRGSFGAAAEGDWAKVLLPSRISSSSNPWGSSSHSLANTIALDSGFGLPPLKGVALALLIYIVLVGPLAWWGLRRIGEPRLFWSVVPLFALMFTGIVWLSGSSVRGDTTNAHGSIIETGPHWAHASSYLLLTSNNGGSLTTPLPQGWRPREVSDSSGFRPRMSSTTIRESGSNTALVTWVDAGGFELVGAAGAAPAFANKLTVTAFSNTDDEIFGELSNGLNVDLHEVAIIAGGAFTKLGTVAAGSSAEYAISGSVNFDSWFGPLEARTWGEAQFFAPSQTIDDGGPLNLALWSQYESGQRSHLRQGDVVAVGWTSELASPMDESLDAGRTLVTTRSRIEAGASDEGAVSSNVLARRTLVRGPSVLREPQNEMMFPGDTLWTFEPPQGASLESLALNLPEQQVQAAIWANGAWRDIAEGSRSVKLDQSVSVNGLVYVLLASDPIEGAFDMGLPVPMAPSNVVGFDVAAPVGADVVTEDGTSLSMAVPEVPGGMPFPVPPPFPFEFGGWSNFGGDFNVARFDPTRPPQSLTEVIVGDR